jgi:hypothetical protein
MKHYTGPGDLKAIGLCLLIFGVLFVVSLLRG